MPRRKQRKSTNEVEQRAAENTIKRSKSSGQAWINHNRGAKTRSSSTIRQEAKPIHHKNSNAHQRKTAPSGPRRARQLERIRGSKRSMQALRRLLRVAMICSLFAGGALNAQDAFQTTGEEQSDQEDKDQRRYLDCQYGQGKWISLIFSPGSSVAVGMINDGAPIFYTSLLSGSRLTLTPRQPGKKLNINLSSLTIRREWYLTDGVGNAGTGECTKGQAPDSGFADDDF
jgi:hypothetical protein